MLPKIHSEESDLKNEIIILVIKKTMQIYEHSIISNISLWLISKLIALWSENVVCWDLPYGISQFVHVPWVHEKKALHFIWMWNSIYTYC